MNLHASSALDGRAPASSRPPLKRVRCLLPIWGYRYVRQFLETGLPTWLAPGNLPALSANLPTEFVLLVSREDEGTLRAHPRFADLEAVCSVTLHYIDHLITGSNYSTTITLAYLEAVRDLGEDALDTCFFFLVADYIVADGSFGNALKRVVGGADALLVGNFQLDERSAHPWLVRQIAPSPGACSLSARLLMRWGLAHLHATTIANMVNFEATNNSHTNRLFWSVDTSTLIGRFYLMHMICIRPQIIDFAIGASCDYSFVPEMCPNGNVEIVTDSDEYLVLEMQPGEHEAEFLRGSRLMPATLARSLSEWTTARHRKNARTTVVFHAEDLPERLGAVIAEADRFVAEVEHLMELEPQPHFDHPYWQGALAAHKEATGAGLEEDEWPLVFGLPNPKVQTNRLMRLGLSLLPRVFGRPPRVRPWHPRRPEFDLVQQVLDGHSAEEKRLLLISKLPTPFSVGLADGTDRVVRLRTSEVYRRSEASFESLRETFDLCLIEITESDLLGLKNYAYFHQGESEENESPRYMKMPTTVLSVIEQRLHLRLDRGGEFATVVSPIEDITGVSRSVDQLIDRAALMMKDGGTILVSVEGRSDALANLTNVLTLTVDVLRRPYATDMKLWCIPQRKLRRWALIHQVRLARGAFGLSLNAWVQFVVLGPFFIALNLVTGALTRPVPSIPGREPICGALVQLTVDSQMVREVKEFSGRTLLGERLSRGTAAAGPDETFCAKVDLARLLSPSKKGHKRHTLGA